MKKIKFIFNDREVRVDSFLQEELKISRTKIQDFFKNNKVLINNQPIKKNFKLIKDQIIYIDQEIEVKQELIKEIKKQNLNLEVVYEDEYIAIINKPNNMVTHPGLSNKDNTLVNGILYLYKDLPRDDENRPGIIHRLDKKTTGLIIIAKNYEAKETFSKLIKDKKVKRSYLAIVHNSFDHLTGKIDASIGRDSKNRKKFKVTNKNAKNAVTNFQVLKTNNKYSLIKCELETGRTHQIRVHFDWINHPIYGDEVYGYKKQKSDYFGQFLHSYELKFYHPFLKKDIQITKEPPLIFKNKINELELDYNFNNGVENEQNN